MDNLIIEKTTTSPAVNFNAESGELRIGGRSVDENPFPLYERLIVWIDQYLQQPQTQTTFTIDLEYFNTSSSKALLNVLKKIKEVTANENKLLVKWCYDFTDEDILDTGNDFSRLLKIPFEFVGKM